MINVICQLVKPMSAASGKPTLTKTSWIFVNWKQASFQSTIFEFRASSIRFLEVTTSRTQQSAATASLQQCCPSQHHRCRPRPAPSLWFHTLPVLWRWQLHPYSWGFHWKWEAGNCDYLLKIVIFSFQFIDVCQWNRWFHHFLHFLQLPHPLRLTSYALSSPSVTISKSSAWWRHQRFSRWGAATVDNQLLIYPMNYNMTHIYII